MFTIQFSFLPISFFVNPTSSYWMKLTSYSYWCWCAKLVAVVEW